MTIKERAKLLAVIEHRYKKIRHINELNYFLSDYHLDKELIELYCMERKYKNTAGNQKGKSCLKLIQKSFKEIIDNYYKESV